MADMYLESSVFLLFLFFVQGVSNYPALLAIDLVLRPPRQKMGRGGAERVLVERSDSA